MPASARRPTPPATHRDPTLASTTCSSGCPGTSRPSGHGSTFRPSPRRVASVASRCIASASRLERSRSVRSGQRRAEAAGSAAAKRRPGSSRQPPTRSARRCARTGSRPKHRRRRSRGRATSSSPPCSSPCRTTCAPRSRPSGPRQARFARTACSAPDEQEETVDAIDREVEYLNRLVTNLLDLSRIEAGALRAERDTFELDDLVGRTVDRLRPRLAGRPLEVLLEAPPVEVDPVFLDEAVTNILENALKYTADGTPLRVSADEVDGDARPADDRGRRRGRARCRPPAALPEVLPGARRPAAFALGDRDRSRRRAGTRRGDGRSGLRPPERAGRPGHRSRPSGGRGCPRRSRPRPAREPRSTGSVPAPRPSWSWRTTRRRAA